MITRKDLKTDAKKVLRRRYWPIFLMSLIQVAIMSMVVINLGVGNMEGIKEKLLYSAIVGISVLIVQVFLYNPFKVAYSRFIVVNSQNEKTDYKVLWDTLKDNYGIILKATFMRDLLIAVCAIPFFIGLALMGVGFIPHFMKLDIFQKLMAFQTFFSPSLVMTTLYYLVFYAGCIIATGGFFLLLYRNYSYRMVDYLVGEMTDSSWEDILLASKKMMKRNKFFACTLDISFFGWIMLSIFVGIGGFFLYPYIDATNAQFYLSLKEKKEDKIIRQ